MLDFLVRATIYSLVFTAIVALLPDTSILPLPSQFTDLLASIFVIIKMFREWPIIRIFVDGLDIYLWFLVIKISWNTIIFIISRFTDFDLIKKLTL